VRLKKTIASLAIASAAGAAVVVWMSCAPRSRTRVPQLSRFSSAIPAFSLAAPAAISAPPQGKPQPASSANVVTVADVLDHASCSTEVVKGLSEQIIAEENCIHPASYKRIPDKLHNATLEETVFPYLMQPAHDALLQALESNRAEAMMINSMLRTIAQQYLLYDWYKRGRCSIKLAASPGRSNHQSGLAIDIAQPARWRTRLARHGFHWMGKKDRWHFDYVGKTREEKENAKRLAETVAGLDVKAFQRLWNRNHPDEKIPEDGEFEKPTEAALRRTPVQGFTVGASCGG
jgi:hypothetical protein